MCIIIKSCLTLQMNFKDYEQDYGWLCILKYHGSNIM